MLDDRKIVLDLDADARSWLANKGYDPTYGARPLKRVIQREVQDAAYRAQLAIDSGAAVVVGVNRFQTEEQASIEVFQVDPAIEAQQVERVRAVRASRSQSAWQAAVDAVRAAARDGANLMPPILTAVEAHATVGEIADALRAEFGEHREMTGE